MEHSFHIYNDRNLLVETWSGQLSLKDLMKAAPEVYAHPDYRQGLNIISDYRNAELQLSYGDIDVLAESFGKTEKWGKMAIVVNTDPVHFGLSRMYQSMTEFHRTHWLAYRIFTSMEEAEAWVG